MASSHRELVLSKLSNCCRASANVSYKYSKVTPRGLGLGPVCSSGGGYSAVRDDRRNVVTGDLLWERRTSPLLLLT